MFHAHIMYTFSHGAYLYFLFDYINLLVFYIWLCILMYFANIFFFSYNYKSLDYYPKL